MKFVKFESSKKLNNKLQILQNYFKLPSCDQNPMIWFSMNFILKCGTQTKLTHSIRERDLTPSSILFFHPVYYFSCSS